VSESHSRRRCSRPRPPSCSGNHCGRAKGQRGPPGPLSPLPRHPPPPAPRPSAPPRNPASSWRGGGRGCEPRGRGTAAPPSRQPGGLAPVYLPRRSSWSGSLSNSSTSTSCPGTSCTMNWGTGPAGGTQGCHPPQHGPAGGVMGVPVSSPAGLGCSWPHGPAGGTGRVPVLPPKLWGDDGEVLGGSPAGGWGGSLCPPNPSCPGGTMGRVRGVPGGSHLIDLVPGGVEAVVDDAAGDHLGANAQDGVGVRLALHQPPHEPVLGPQVPGAPEMHPHHALRRGSAGGARGRAPPAPPGQRSPGAGGCGAGQPRAGRAPAGPGAGWAGRGRRRWRP